MKPKKATPSKPKLNFAVDRSEFDISSDWVQAVMGQPSLPRQEAPFFSSDTNNATDAPSTTDTACTTGAISTTGEQVATEEMSAPVADRATEEHFAPVVATKPALNPAAVDKEATVADSATVATKPIPDAAVARLPIDYGSAVANNSTDRKWHLRPLRRVTDGLTPGQFAVYSLMLQDADSVEGGEAMYRGGYADLVRLTGLSKRGIQNVIAELQEKGVIRLHTAPGHHRSQTSAYMVPAPEVVVTNWHARGWRFAIGKSKRLTDGATVAISAGTDAT